MIYFIRNKQACQDVLRLNNSAMNHKKIRVVHILEATAGGTKKHLMDIALGLDRTKYEVTIICSTLREKSFYKDIEHLRNNGIKVKIIKMKRAVRSLADLAAFFRIYWYLRCHPVDILHTHSSKAGFLGRLAGKLAGVKPILYSPHCYYFQQKEGFARFFFRFLEQFAGFFTDKFVCVSEGERHLTIQERISKPHKTVTIANGIDPSEFVFEPRIAETKRILGIETDASVVGTVTRFTAQKGYRVFFQAALQVHKIKPDIFFLVVGSEDHKAKAEKLIDQLGMADRVILAGKSGEVRDLLSVMDIFVLCSFWEGLPYALLEAMAMEKPVVASRIPGISEVVHHEETGYLVDPGEPAAFAERILDMLDNKERAMEVGRKGNIIVKEKYQLETQIQMLSKLYEELFVAKKETSH